ncbi:MAG TPA: hypothetical protein VFY16_04150 [Gemmatimonadaceae bacterium]|nr:hypothetical protein [Gemmatimonadaceae bacterium]
MLQAVPILDRVASALERRHAIVERASNGEVRFRVPPVWRAGLLQLHPITRGRVWLGAGWGEPWRIRYELRYTRIKIAGLLVSAALVYVSWTGPRTLLVNELLWLWGLIYFYIFVTRQRFRRLLMLQGHAVVERESPNGGRTSRLRRLRVPPPPSSDEPQQPA